MSLNDGQLDDLTDNTLVDNVQAPSVVPPASEDPLTVIPESNQLKGQAIELEAEFEAKLPAMDVTLKLVEGNHSKLVDLEEVDQTILGEGKVSQDGADTINVAAEGLYEGPISRLHYTQMPSSLNFGHVKKHMQSRIALESEQLMSNFKAMVDKPIEDAKCVLAELQSSYLPHLRSTTSALNQDAVTMPEKIAACKHLFAQFGKEFLDLSKIDLTAVPKDSLINGSPRFAQLAGALAKLMENKQLKAYVLAVGANVDPGQAESCGNILLFTGAPVTIGDLVNFYRYTGLVDATDDLVNIAQMYIRVLEKIQANGKTLQDNPTAIREYLIENGEDLTAAAQNHVKFTRRVLDLTYLNFISQEFFDFFAKQ